MSPDLSENLADEAALALAHSGPIVRDALRIFLEFDSRLARIVSGTTEPMLGQMRLAWWRDALGIPVSDRPTGDHVLDAIGERWAGGEKALIALVDGWEHMLCEPPLSREAALAFAQGRGAGFAGLSAITGGGEALARDLEAAGQVWAVADAASHVAQGEERQTLLDLAASLPRPGRLPAPYRGVAILGSLGARALKAGGAPLMAGRGAALVAFRAGLLGR